MTSSEQRSLKFQEGSLLKGLAYIVSVVSLFDEHANDLLYLREGSCLPRYNFGIASPKTPKEKEKENCS